MTNQPPPHEGHNAFTTDGAVRDIVRNLPRDVQETFATQGAWVAAHDALDLARMANEHTPQLRTHDARGERVDTVEYHPAYHALMRRGTAIGLNASVWEDNAQEEGIRHLSRAVRFMLTSQLEAGHLCPLTMTNASVAALMTTPHLSKEWQPRIMPRDYDSSQKIPVEKSALTIGMGMTERQGGSDLRSNTCSARPTNEGGAEGTWLINGEKWFLSAPMCDGFLLLAQTDKGLSCFLVPRILPDGRRNGLHFRRLKNKLGNRSNASSEVELVNVLGSLVGEEGRGIATILEMVTLTRLDCAVGSAGLMRAALAEATHHCRHRAAFGKTLIDQPMMQRVLADLALDVTAAQALALRLAASFDRAPRSEREQRYVRLMTPVIKYWICKIAPALIYEALECVGGNGFIEESVLPRLYREAPLNAIWEGSGNVMCLDVMRVMERGPQCLPTVLDILAEDLGNNASQSIDVLRVAGDMAVEDPGSARIFTEQLALTAAAAEMRRSLPGEIADAFIESRLGRPWRHTYGMMDTRYNARAIIDYVHQP